MGRRASWQAEDGFGLIEVMVTCVVVVLVAAATVSSIASSQHASSRTIGRNILANLAEQDQERMKAMRASDLASYTATRTVAQQGVNYQVDSSTEFVQDANGPAVSCTSSGSQSTHMRLTTTVTPPASLRTDPLIVKSLYALPIAQYSPTSGTLVVKIFKRDGVTPLQGVPVSVAGPGSRSGVTNAEGCAIFQFLTPGAYSITYSKGGYVDPSLASTVTFSGTVTPANINQATPQIYDLAGSITAKFDGGTTSIGPGITVANGGLPAPGTKVVNGGRVAPGLFPFTGAYAVYSGTCAANDPSKYDPNYFTATRPESSAVVDPGAGATADVHEPTIRATATVKDSSAAATPRSGMTIYLREADTGCGGDVYGPFGANATTGAWQGNLPYGTYDVCAQWTRTSGSTSTIYYALRTGVANTDFAGTPNQALSIVATGSTAQALPAGRTRCLP
jgi:Tfp pilus assembly protein PilV